MGTKVFYPTMAFQSKAFLGETPTKEVFDRDYRLVFETSEAWGAEVCFSELNYRPEQYIRYLPEEVKHTSMRVGDIVELDNGQLLIAQDVGFRKLPFKNEFTREQRKCYLKKDSVCPYCGEPNIDGGDMEFEGGHISQEIRCTECGKEWYDIYKLIGIEKRG